ncbi:AVB_G0051520.mRNA.1.CDS.1 [Saccharomyces cerevisiae]|nr:Faa1p [Saccharomyces cerevisiae YJM1078]AJT73192.1 Faa1p [Saccharomyces cerevisiae YJM248]CAI4799164.1 AIE_G0051870.mRNA.1.CDS.1 [Saccharomyces cerevisiae]CAI4802062.1 AVB_G0051520.mRNA.1.CDS.1 [Saccharomyces cerevisiae]CAI6891571.1 AIE_G0051870.mRNA.1.CDS.1 [Saccharomyces cerevisiae]
MVAQYTVPVGKAANEHETAPRRNYQCREKPLVRPPNTKCSTVYEFVLECFQKNKNSNAMGWRDVKEIHEESKSVMKKVDGKETSVEKKWMYYELSHYHYNSFDQLTDIMHEIGRGLVKIGLKPNDDDKLHLYAATSHKWMKMFLGAQSQGIPVVTAYDTLGEKGLIHSLVQTGSKAIFTDNSLLPSLIKPVQAAQDVKYIIHFDSISSEDRRQSGKIYQSAHDAINRIKEVRPDIKTFSFDDILKLGKESCNEIDVHPPGKDDLCCIMYTSGSTGEPKGVVLKHSNVVAGVGGASLNVLKFVGNTDRVICFLPLAHIFELVFELLSFYWGACIGYATVKTLTSSSVRNCQGDLQEFKPTIMVGVAAVWETVRKGILNQIDNLPFLTKKIFWTAYNTKLNMQRLHIPGGGALGNLVFKTIRTATGGQLRYLLNGGSPISRDAQEFITNLICPMLIGYGLTETCASTTILDPANFELGVAGDLTGCVTVKLVDVEELGYFAKNNQGEVWITGANVTPEYYKNEEETSQALTSDGWFKTGDIGEWEANGHLKIIDRKKNLVKTMNGEYIALEKLESVYRSNEYVANICVYADQSKTKPVGIIVPNHAPLTKLAKKLGIMEQKDSSINIENYLEDAKLIKAVYSDLLKTGKDQGLVGIELLAGIVFFDGEWTPQNGFVTSAQKLKRKDILNAVKDKVDAVYSSS